MEENDVDIGVTTGILADGKFYFHAEITTVMPENDGLISKKLKDQICCVDLGSGKQTVIAEYLGDDNRIEFLAAGGSCSITVTVTLPENTPVVSDCNLFVLTARNEGGETLLTHQFGIAGATPWKLSGPFWRTEPCCTTQDILAHFADPFPYKALMERSCIPGNRKDKTRHFHLNFATDTTTEYLPRDQWAVPLSPDFASDTHCRTLVSTHEDSFRLEDFFGFRGPCVVYLSRMVVAPEDMTVCMQIGHTAPFAAYLNGEEIASRDFCDSWTAENVHLENIHLNKGDNLLTLRLTRVNDDAKFNIHFCKGMTCDAHYTVLASRNPWFWGK